jgi:formate dehydrogenase subunit gamma
MSTIRLPGRSRRWPLVVIGAVVVAIVGHIYLGTAALPGTFHSMTRGTVTRSWARLHHPGWFRQVSGQRRDNRT